MLVKNVQEKHCRIALFLLASAQASKRSRFFFVNHTGASQHERRNAMKASKCFLGVLSSVAVLFLFSIVLPAHAGLLDEVGSEVKKAGKNLSNTIGTEKLPGGVSSRLKKMHQEMDRAESALEKGAGTGVDRARRAEQNLKRAGRYKQEIERQYSGKYSEDHPDVAEAFGRLARLEEQVQSSGESAADECGNAA